ncbi:hypothetical protein D3C81_2094430 [compost metagenome]
MKIVDVSVTDAFGHFVYFHSLTQQLLGFLDADPVQIGVKVLPRLVLEKLSQIGRAVVQQSG